MTFILKFEKKIADSSSVFINPLYIFFYNSFMTDALFI